MSNENFNPRPAFAPMVQFCREHGISRSQAYRLASRGTLQTFNIGRRRFVTVESIRQLPSTLNGGTA